MPFRAEAQGTVLVVRDDYRPTQLRTRGATKRSSIRVFSRASRRRLIELMARMDVRQIRSTFLTLTFSGTPSAHEAKRAFKAFTMRMRRKFPQASAIWRMEHQQRGAIHFHLICFNLPYWSQKQIQYAWECCTNEQTSIVHVKLLRGGKRQAMYYTAKYIAKDAVSPASLDTAAYPHGEGSETEDEPGRFWGWINRVCMPFAVRHCIAVDDDEMLHNLWITMAVLSHGAAAQQRHSARFYGTCCYELAETMVKNGKLLLYNITHTAGEKLRWYETFNMGGMPLVHI